MNSPPKNLKIMYTPFSIQLLLGLKKRINGKPKFTLICVESSELLTLILLSLLLLRLSGWATRIIVTAVVRTTTTATDKRSDGGR